MKIKLKTARLLFSTACLCCALPEVLFFDVDAAETQIINKFQKDAGLKENLQTLVKERDLTSEDEQNIARQFAEEFEKVTKETAEGWTKALNETVKSLSDLVYKKIKEQAASKKQDPKSFLVSLACNKKLNDKSLKGDFSKNKAFNKKIALRTGYLKELLENTESQLDESQKNLRSLVVEFFEKSGTKLKDSNKKHILKNVFDEALLDEIKGILKQQEDVQNINLLISSKDFEKMNKEMKKVIDFRRQQLALNELQKFVQDPNKTENVSNEQHTISNSVVKSHTDELIKKPFDLDGIKQGISKELKLSEATIKSGTEVMKKIGLMMKRDILHSNAELYRHIVMHEDDSAYKNNSENTFLFRFFQNLMILGDREIAFQIACDGLQAHIDENGGYSIDVKSDMLWKEVEEKNDNVLEKYNGASKTLQKALHPSWNKLINEKTIEADGEYLTMFQALDKILGGTVGDKYRITQAGVYLNPDQLSNSHLNMLTSPDGSFRIIVGGDELLWMSLGSRSSQVLNFYMENFMNFKKILLPALAVLAFSNGASFDAFAGMGDFSVGDRFVSKASEISAIGDFSGFVSALKTADPSVEASKDLGFWVRNGNNFEKATPANLVICLQKIKAALEALKTENRRITYAGEDSYLQYFFNSQMQKDSINDLLTQFEKLSNATTFKGISEALTALEDLNLDLNKDKITEKGKKDVSLSGLVGVYEKQPDSEVWFADGITNLFGFLRSKLETVVDAGTPVQWSAFFAEVQKSKIDKDSKLRNADIACLEQMIKKACDESAVQKEKTTNSKDMGDVVSSFSSKIDQAISDYKAFVNPALERKIGGLAVTQNVLDGQSFLFKNLQTQGTIVNDWKEFCDSADQVVVNIFSAAKVSTVLNMLKKIDDISGCKKAVAQFVTDYVRKKSIDLQDKSVIQNEGQVKGKFSTPSTSQSQKTKKLGKKMTTVSTTPDQATDNQIDNIPAAGIANN